MATAGGPNIERDGLVFGYDTGANPSSNFNATSTPRRYFKGQPATNIITGNIPTYFGSSGEALYQNKYLGFTSLSGVFQRNYVTNPATSDIAAFNNNAGLTKGSLSISNLSASTTYLQISFDFYLITPYIRINNTTGLGGYMYVQYTDDSFGSHPWNTTYSNGSSTEWSSNSAYVGKWQKVSLIAGLNSQKTPSSINTFYIYMDRATQGEGIFTNFIITEHSSFPTGPVLYTSSSRSSTQSLIDLTKSTAIDVSNVSFGSDGLPTFDGTDDKIVIADQTSIGAYTYETVVKINSSDSSYSGFGSNYKSDASGYSGVGNGWVLRLDPSGTLQVYTKNNSTTLINPINISGFRASNLNTYIHLVYTYEDGSNKIYLNGVLQQTGTGLSGETASDSTLIIGAYSWGISSQTYYLNGHQPVAKLYNRALSAQEVQQNFKAYKNRFNI